MARPPSSASSPGWVEHRAPPLLWDPVIRITHWAIAVIVLLNAVLTDGGSLVHVSAGWLGISFLVLRLVWGFTGPAEARFSSFPPNPGAALAHLRDLTQGSVREYRSHNPAGAMMVYALWTLLLVVTMTGLVMTSGKTPLTIAAEKAAVEQGDWSALVKQGETEQDGDEDGGNANPGHLAEEVHEVAANLILFLVVLHVVGVVVESHVMRRNLIAAMMTGARDAAPPARYSRNAQGGSRRGPPPVE
ncbi:MAG: cytochrome b/b6 domain-containing protein [Paracoccaceae bacterium]